MHIYFSGIGGTAIGPLALIAHQAGFTVSGSDKQSSLYIDNLRKHGITDIHIGQTKEAIAAVHAAKPIDWLVYTSALPIEQPDAPELQFCREQGIKTSKRDELLNAIIEKKSLRLLAIAGTHGKTTTTAMAIWMFKELGLPVSYSVGAKLRFGDMGEYDPSSEYFVYEADEFDRNFLAFNPFMTLISGIDWDHRDIYPTREAYNAAFVQFLDQSTQAILWDQDAATLQLLHDSHRKILQMNDERLQDIHLPGRVNRFDALLVLSAMEAITGKPYAELAAIMERFPGVSRRFEQIAPNIYSDYAHTPPKIQGALQLAHEIGGDNVVVVYEGLHNTRQHFIKDSLRAIFSSAKQVYIVPTYLAREDPNLAVWTPEDIRSLFDPPIQERTQAATLDEHLHDAIAAHAAAGDIVLCISAGGGGSLDEWLRVEFPGETA